MLMQPDANAPAPTPKLRKILCIEDEHFIGELYTRALTRAGYEVDVELDGQKGLAAAQTDAYDIILLDLMVPHITGIEVLRTLRDPRQTPKMHARIIITTNLEQRDDVRADIERQADGYIVKAEITPRQLVEFLAKLEP
ncbi:response regulator [Candidatus Saccharibacteria bacterium]|nr:MAG: response regulator [Candidatus Saccharibacteria bacterium]PID99532.1 MAG: response regulator [Candidatus Saccharibacteria bacterium]